jgi:hypothetical protein
MLPIRIFRDTDDPKKPSFHSPLSERKDPDMRSLDGSKQFGGFPKWEYPKSSKLGPFHETAFAGSAKNFQNESFGTSGKSCFMASAAMAPQEKQALNMFLQ